MRLFNFFKKKKLLLLNILLTLYIATNMIGGERGLVSYYEKEKKQQSLIEKEKLLSEKLDEFEKKNKLLSTNLNLDYIDMIFREKLKFGKKEEIIIKLK
jgi:cell division protein FtsB